MATVPLGEPDQITAGDTIKWRRKEADYLPENGWSLRYVLVRNLSQVEFTTSDNGDGTHLVSVATTVSEKWPAGTYRWQVYAEKGTERFTLARGSIEVRPNFQAKSAGYDDRSHVKKTLDAIEAVIENRASQDQESYTINGRSLSRTPVDQLLMFYDKYKRLYQQEIRAQKLADGKASGGKVLVRFQ